VEKSFSSFPQKFKCLQVLENQCIPKPNFSGNLNFLWKIQLEKAPDNGGKGNRDKRGKTPRNRGIRKGLCA